jgi:hypothetical protein
MGRKLMQWETVFQIVATLACGIFSGAALYINLVEHPARMQCGTALAATEFGPSYHRAAVMQASLAAIGFLSALGAWLTGASHWWVVGGTPRFSHPVYADLHHADEQETPEP